MSKKVKDFFRIKSVSNTLGAEICDTVTIRRKDVTAFLDEEPYEHYPRCVKIFTRGGHIFRVRQDDFYRCYGVEAYEQ